MYEHDAIRKVFRRVGAGAGRSSPVWVAALLAAFAVPGGAQGQDANRRNGDAFQTVSHSLELYLSDIAIEARYIRQLDVSDFGRVDGSVGVIFNEERDLVAEAELITPLRRYESRRLQVRGGSRAYGAFLSTENEDVFGIGLGGEVNYFFGNSRNTWLTGRFFYTPDILTFGAADNVTDASMRIDTRLNNGTVLFAGYRLLEFDLRPGSHRVDDHLHVGFRRDFGS